MNKKLKLILFTIFLPSIDEQMALVTLPKAFKMLLKIRQRVGISHHGAEVTNINIWAPLRFSHNVFVFS